MDEYLENLRGKPAHHKKFFAFGVSSCVVAIIFLIWSFAKFGGAATVVAENIPDAQVEAVSPFEGIGNGLASAWTSMTGQFKSAKKEINTIELESKYQQIRNDALEN